MNKKNVPFALAALIVTAVILTPIKASVYFKTKPVKFGYQIKKGGLMDLLKK